MALDRFLVARVLPLHEVADLKVGALRYFEPALRFLQILQRCRMPPLLGCEFLLKRLIQGPGLLPARIQVGDFSFQLALLFTEACARVEETLGATGWATGPNSDPVSSTHTHTKRTCQALLKLLAKLLAVTEVPLQGSDRA